MKIKENILGFIIVLFIFGGIITSSSLGFWQTTSSKIPITFNEGDFKGEYNPADIRGSYTLREVSDLFNVPLDDISKAFNLIDREDINILKAKDFEEIYAYFKDQGFEIGTDSLRIFISLYKGLPYELSEDTYLFKEALNVLKEKSNLSDEQLEYLNTHTVDFSNFVADDKDSNLPIQEEEYDEMVIKGKTTFKELLDWGVPKVDIESIIEEKIPNPVMVIRDYCIEKGLAFSDIKAKLQEKLDDISNK